MFRFLGSLYKMKTKQNHRFDDAEHSPPSCPPLTIDPGVGPSEQHCLCFSTLGLISVTWELESMRAVETDTFFHLISTIGLVKDILAFFYKMMAVRFTTDIFQVLLFISSNILLYYF